MDGPFSPEFLQRFEVHGPLGKGGMGTVYRGTQVSLGRPVAIKLLSAELLEPSFLARFESEARVVANLFHTNLVAVIETGRTADRPYIVFELVDGPSLRDHLDAHGNRLPLRQALTFTLQAAQGLACAHGAGVIHRDLKPENLLVAPQGVIKVADFGLAKKISSNGSTQTAAGTVLGTPAYMSPEQALEKEPGPASDVYALGVILHELIAGERPFQGPSLLETMQKHIHEPPPDLPSSVPPKVRAIVRQALEKAPADRFVSMDHLAEALSAAVASLTIADDAPVPARTSQTVQVPRAPAEATPARFDTVPRSGGSAPTTLTATRRPLRTWITGAMLLALVSAAVAVTRPRAVAPESEIEANYQVALAANPRDVEVLSNLAILYRDTGRFPDEAAMRRRITEVSPQNARARQLLGQALLRLGQPGLAAAELQRGIELDPRDPECHVELGKALMAQRHVDEAAAAYRRALELNPRHADALNSLGAILIERGAFRDAEALLRRAIEVNPRYSFALCNLGVAVHRQGDDKGAETFYRRAAEADPANLQALIFYGGALINRRQLDVAEEPARRAVALAPQNATAHNNLGTWLWLKGRLTEAEAEYRLATQLDPRSADPRRNLAMLLQQKTPATPRQR